METMIEYVHNRIKRKDYQIAIDFTMGNGHDTLFLSKVAKQVYSFDIQQEALNNTKKLIEDTDNVNLILASHENFYCLQRTVRHSCNLMISIGEITEIKNSYIKVFYIAIKIFMRS